MVLNCNLWIFFQMDCPADTMSANSKGAIISDNVDFTLTFFDACVIYSICKADLRQKMWS